MSSAVNWLPLVFTTLGGGAVGSLIATYGSQARDRRAARSEAMASIQRFELARGKRSCREIVDCDDGNLIEVETRCLLAGIPRYLVDLYKMLNESLSYHVAPYAAETSDPDSPIDEEKALGALEVLVIHSAVTRAAALLASAVWHPWLTAPSRRWRAWQLRSLFTRRQRNHQRELEAAVAELGEFDRYKYGGQPPLPGSDQP